MARKTDRAADESALAIAAEHNVGDLGAPAVQMNDRGEVVRFLQRSDYGIVPKMNICARDIVHRNRPNHNFQFFWCAFNDEEGYQDAKEDGYVVVTEADWICNREGWSWGKPEKDRFRWSTAGMLVFRDFFLMARDQDLFEKQRRLREHEVERRIQDRYEGEAAGAQRASFDAGVEGLEVTAVNSGQEFTATGVRRKPTAI